MYIDQHLNGLSRQYKIEGNFDLWDVSKTFPRLDLEVKQLKLLLKCMLCVCVCVGCFYCGVCVCVRVCVYVCCLVERGGMCSLGLSMRPIS